MITLITGGIKSGKTSYALKIALLYNKRAYLATAEPIDDEMKNKIDRHKKERNNFFDTIEEPIEIANKLLEIKGYDVVVLDCITTWLGNLFYHEKNIEKYENKLLQAIKQIGYNLIIITNEVGLGVIPNDELSRKYVNELGSFNQKLAKAADECILMISGIPLKIK